MSRISRTSEQSGGFALMEVVLAGSILLVGLLALAGVLVTVSQQRDATSRADLVLSRAESLLEELKGRSPEDVEAYHGKRFDVPGVEGAFSGESALEVRVDDTSDRLIVVMVAGAWNSGNRVDTLLLQTEIFNSNGKK